MPGEPLHVGGMKADASRLSGAGAKPIFIFAYGTLKQGFSNAHMLGSAPLVLANAHTRHAEYEMLSFGSYPAVVPGTWRIAGQVFSIEVAALDDLDAFEQHPTVYRRRLVEVAGLDHPAWMYVMNPSCAREACLPGSEISANLELRLQCWTKRA